MTLFPSSGPESGVGKSFFFFKGDNDFFEGEDLFWNGEELYLKGEDLYFNGEEQYLIGEELSAAMSTKYLDFVLKVMRMEFVISLRGLAKNGGICFASSEKLLLEWI